MLYAGDDLIQYISYVTGSLFCISTDKIFDHAENQLRKYPEDTRLELKLS